MNKPAGGGKALEHGEKVLTSRGWKNIEDILEGDVIITPSNTEEVVTGVFHQGVVPIYNVTFQDGRVVNTCGEHLWKFHRSGNGKKSSKVGNTLEMKRCVDTQRKHSKGCPIIQMTSPISFPKEDLPIDPYVMGLILGDGGVTSYSTIITTEDQFILDEIERIGYKLGKVQHKDGNRAVSVGILDFGKKIQESGVRWLKSNKKFIPDQYKKGTIEDRFSIIQGLMDTDGYIGTNGNTEFYTTSPFLAESVRDILFSLGFSVTTNIKKASYKKDGVKIECCDCYRLYIRGIRQDRLFRLPRKKSRVSAKEVGLKVVSVEYSHDNYATCISISGEEKLFLTTNYVVTHNTRMCLTKYLGYLNDPNFRGVVLRQSAPQLSVSGGIIDESHQIYPHFGGIYKTQAKKWIFPSGATLQFAAIGDDRDLPGWQGSQLTNVLIDEAAEWTEKQVIFLMSRLRSSNFKGKMQIILSANPSNSSYLYSWVAPLLDKKTGVPKDGTEDIVRWFVNINEKIRWGSSPQELYNEYGKGKTLGKDFIPKSFRFIPLSLYSNVVLMQNNPDYLAGLLAQSKVNQLRFLHGSWTAVPDGGTYWKSDWCKIIRPNEVPDDIVCVRGYDFAGSAPSAALPNPDWSVGVKMGRSKSTGCYYVLDVNRFRKNTHEVLEEVIQTANMDGLYTQLIIPRDTAAGGKFAYAFTVQRLAEAGIASRPDVQSGHANKLQKFLPFCSVSEAGLVYIVAGEWNDDYINELSQFAGGSRSLKDDQVDATATAFKFLAKSGAIPSFSLPDMSKPTYLVN